MKGVSYLAIFVSSLACVFMSIVLSWIYIAILWIFYKWNFLEAVFYPASIIVIIVISYLIIFFGGYLAMQFNNHSPANALSVGVIFFAINFASIFIFNLDIEAYHWLILFTLCAGAIPASVAGGKFAEKTLKTD